MNYLLVKDLYPLFVIFLIKMVNVFSSPLPKELLVKSIALAGYHSSGKKRRRIENHLSEVFRGKLDKKQRREISKGIFLEFWRETFSQCPTLQERTAFKRVTVQGLDHLKKALENGKGVILWESNAFGGRGVSKQILHENGFSIYQVFGDQHLTNFLNLSRPPTWVRNHIIWKELERFAKPFLADIIYLPSSDSLVYTRILLDRLKQNAILCIPGDGRTGKKLIPIKFLGRMRQFSTGMVSLAKISGASLLPLFCLQKENGNLSLVIESPICIEGGSQREQALENGVHQYVSLLESYIRRYPNQYRDWGLFPRSTDGNPEI